MPQQPPANDCDAQRLFCCFACFGTVIQAPCPDFESATPGPLRLAVCALNDDEKVEGEVCMEADQSVVIKYFLFVGVCKPSRGSQLVKMDQQST
eukprot:scaffold7432_cov13-Prasinocladus_malaysianus.AAC.1